MSITVSHSSFSVADFLDWQRDGTLELRPPFQRNYVWKPASKSSFIDSLLRGYPVPAMFLQERSGGSSTRFSRRLRVIDGQQRLRTAIAFVDASLLADRGPADDFTLLRVHDHTRAGLPYRDLPAEDQEQILGARLSVEIVDSSVSEAEVLEIFRRMNAYGARLNAQELRNARWAGVFKEVAYRIASELLDIWLRWKVFSRSQIAEMRDAEFVSDLLILMLEGTQASSVARIDRAYEDYDQEFPLADRCQERVMHILNLLDSTFTEPSEVRRLTTKMWLYSWVDVLQTLLYDGPIGQGRDTPRKPPRKRLQEVALGVNAAIETGELPDHVLGATRGAANDLKSRAARASFLHAQLT